ncbi:MAG: ABC transporter substrate-binding protein [Solirubrobacteraceae bacterium]
MKPPLLLTHGCSLSNLPLFVAAGAGLFAAEGLEVDVRQYDEISCTADALTSGVSELGTAAFTQPLIDAERPNPPRMVAGSGLMGISLLAAPEITTVAQLSGNAVATFPADPLELLLHDCLTGAGLTATDVDIRCFDRIEDAISAWRQDEVAALTLAEPHATRVRDAGARELSDGCELWGDGFPDTVLVASERLLAEQPEVVVAAIRAMLAGQASIQRDLAGSIELAGHHFPGFTLDELWRAASRQPPCIDVRHLVSTVLGRWPALQALGHASLGPAPTDAVQLDLLDAALGLVHPPHRPFVPRGVLTS